MIDSQQCHIALEVVLVFSRNVEAGLLTVEQESGLREVSYKRLAGEGVDAITSTPGEFTARMRSEIEKWGKVVRASGAKAE